MAGRHNAWRFDTPFVSQDYRRSNRQTRFLVGFVTLAGLALFLFCLFLPDNSDDSALLGGTIRRQYNDTYPLTPPVVIGKEKKFKICLIADPDTSSRNEDQYYSNILFGTLMISDADEIAKVTFSPKPENIKSGYSLSGRGMELSDIIVFDGNVLTVDDRTGIVFKITPSHKLVPWQILSDGDGLQEKGFKAEWMTVKDSNLYVGGLGKEWADSHGKIYHRNPEYIKKISFMGTVEHINWNENYLKLRKETGYAYPSYLLHESCNWSHYYKQWFFLPRRTSKEPYDEVLDEQRGGNLLIRANSDFSQISWSQIGDLRPSRGFSAFRFIPGFNDKYIVALKTAENPETKKMKSFLSVFTVDGKVMIDDISIGDEKYEGIDFL